ncbi:MAG: class IV adenylate cyclase [Thermoanaerobaculia bacterium]
MSGGPGPREIEVKLPAADLEEVRRRLRERGGTLERARHSESNDLYDDPGGRLLAAGCALRLRRTEGESRLTFKGPARFEQGIRSREERETTVGDAGEAAAILARLGLTRRFRYEKRREEWRLLECAVALDETPIGDFVEIEGDPAAIRKALAALELDFASALPYSYAHLYALKRKENPALPSDMVFESR